LKFRTFAINLNTKCNLRCGYCFIPHDTKTGEEISYLMINDVKNFILKYSEGESNVSIDIFGTEPLISWDKLVHIIGIAKVYGWKVGVTTNVTLMSKERAQFLADNNVGLLVSYDGSRKSHNRFRKFKSGQGSWQKVVQGLKMLHDAGVKYGCAMVVSPENLPYLLHNVKSAATRGFEYIALNPQFTIGESKHPTGYDWEILRKKYRDAATWALDNGVPLLFTVDAMEGYKRGDVRLLNSTCGAARGSIGIDWDGKVYICHRACGRKEFQLGDVRNGVVDELV